MSALALTSAAGMSRTDWVPIDEAARLLGMSEGALRRLCSTRLKAQGMAVQRKRDNGGPACWHVSAAHDWRLVRRGVEQTETGTSVVNDLLEGASAEKREQAETLAQIVIEFRRFKSSPTTRVREDLPAFTERMKVRFGSCPGRSRLYDLDSQCPSSDDFPGCVATCLDQRGRPRGGATTVSDKAWEQFCGLYLTPQLWSVRKCYDAVAALAKEEGWAWPSYRRVLQLIGERLTPGMITLKREGRDAWSKRHAAPMEQDPEAWDAGQCWEGDHSVLDFSCRVLRGDKWRVTRAQLTAWIDRRSRRLMGYHISEQGNSSTIRLALIAALRDPDASRPDIVWIDNGKDFMAASLTGMTKRERRQRRGERDETETRCAGLLGMLGIEPHFATPYNHNGKARVERFFGLVHERFDKEFASYVGNRVGMVDRRERKDDLTNTHTLPTIDEIRERFDEFATWYNHRSDHRIDDLVDREKGGRLSPEEFYQRHLPKRQLVNQDSLKLLEQVWEKPRKVHKWGVSVPIGGRVCRFGEMEPALDALVGTNRRVFVSFDPSDTTRVHVWDQDFKLVCVATENGRYGGISNDRVTVQDRKVAWSERRAQKRELERKIDMTTASLSDPELASRAARERDIAETQDRIAKHDRTLDRSELPPLRLVTTPLDGQSDDLEREEMRLAAGAEHEPEPEIDLGSLELVGQHEDEQPDLSIEFDADDHDDEPTIIEGLGDLDLTDTDGEEMPNVLDLVGEHFDGDG